MTTVLFQARGDEGMNAEFSCGIPLYDVVLGRDSLADGELVFSCQHQSKSPLLLEHLLGNEGCSVDRQADLFHGSTGRLPPLLVRVALVQAAVSALNVLRELFRSARIALPRLNALREASQTLDT